MLRSRRGVVRTTLRAHGGSARCLAEKQVVGVSVEEREQAQVLVVQTQTDVELTSAILGHLNGGQVGRVSRREPTLEDAYVALVTEE